MPSSALWRFRRSSRRRMPECRRIGRLQFRIGIHVGDVVVRGGDLLGDGVNVAARLEGLAEPGGIAISGAAHGYVRKALPLAYTDLGEQHVKNIDEPVRAYAVRAATRCGSGDRSPTRFRCPTRRPSQSYRSQT